MLIVRYVAAVMNRELQTLFYSPVAYIVIAGYLLITGVIAVDAFRPGEPATLRGVFAFAPYILAIIVPAITMRAIAEEYRAGTIESLMTTPISDAQMVLGKFLATLVFYIVMTAATFVYVVLLAMYGSPDLGAALAAYLGLLLLGGALLAVGLFASSLTQNQIVAWMIAAVPLILFVWFASFLGSQLEGTWRELVRTVDVSLILSQFNRGLVTVEAVIFFVATTVYFLFLAVKVVESRRWR
jgi:ABC-2 type transport system permease protein